MIIKSARRSAAPITMPTQLPTRWRATHHGICSGRGVAPLCAERRGCAEVVS